MTRTVEVLLATYNGARFLREQIDSVLAQVAVDVRILARDDGSEDDTPSILAEYVAAQPERFRVLPTEVATGAAQRNFHLLLLASSADYVAFCDQDDVWLPHKLQTTLARMQQLEDAHGSGTPLLVSTDLRVVDEGLGLVAASLWQRNGLANAMDPPLGQLLSGNTVTGCTTLLNRALVQRMTTMPRSALMHDHWAALVAASTGVLAGIGEATVLYRQHGGNVVGAIAERSAEAKLQRLFGRQALEDRALQYRKDRAQARALLALHGDAMNAAARATVEAFVALGDMGRFARLRAMQLYGLWRGERASKIVTVMDVLRG